MKTKLKELREESKLTQEQLGKYLGVSSMTFDEFETGSCNMSVHQIEKICNLFRCSEAYLFGREENNNPLNFSFPNQVIEVEDLEAIASINKIVRNIQYMN